MSELAPTLFPLPDETLLEFAPLDCVENPILRVTAEYWKQLCGSRHYPAREELNPGRFGSALRHMALVRVIEGGVDFEYRIVGDAFARAFGVSLNSRKLSVIAAEAPAAAAVIGRVYGQCVKDGEPFVVYGTIGRASDAARFMRLEAVIMPLGMAEIDHLLTFMVYDAAG